MVGVNVVTLYQARSLIQAKVDGVQVSGGNGKKSWFLTWSRFRVGWWGKDSEIHVHFPFFIILVLGFGGEWGVAELVAWKTMGSKRCKGHQGCAWGHGRDNLRSYLSERQWLKGNRATSPTVNSDIAYCLVKGKTDFIRNHCHSFGVSNLADEWTLINKGKERLGILIHFIINLIILHSISVSNSIQSR